MKLQHPSGIIIGYLVLLLFSSIKTTSASSTKLRRRGSRVLAAPTAQQQEDKILNDLLVSTSTTNTEQNKYESSDVSLGQLRGNQKKQEQGSVGDEIDNKNDTVNYHQAASYRTRDLKKAKYQRRNPPNQSDDDKKRHEAEAAAAAAAAQQQQELQAKQLIEAAEQETELQQLRAASLTMEQIVLDFESRTLDLAMEAQDMDILSTVNLIQNDIAVLRADTETMLATASVAAKEMLSSSSLSSLSVGEGISNSLDGSNDNSNSLDGANSISVSGNSLDSPDW